MRFERKKKTWATILGMGKKPHSKLNHNKGRLFVLRSYD